VRGPVVTAPPGPPYNTASFLDRLDANWFQHAWGDGRHPRQAEQARAAARHLRNIQLRYVTLLDRLGPALDDPGTLDEADAWYFILEGTREPSVAEAQAMAITELAARAATALDGEPRARIRRGRPLRLAIRAIIAAVLSLLVLNLISGQPAAPADILGLIICSS